MEDRLVAIVMMAHQGRLSWILGCAALMAASIALRTAPGRRWYDVLSTFFFLLLIFSLVVVLTLQLFFDVPVAGLEVVSFRE